MKSTLFLMVSLVVLSGCSTLPESADASVEIAWDLADQLEDRNGLTIAIAEIDADNIPDSLVKAYREQLGTNMAIAFREYGVNNVVVTRDRVDSVLDEYALELEGLTYGDAQDRLGQVLGADVLVTGRILRLEGGTFRGMSQLIEVESGVVLGGTTWDFWFDDESGG